MNATRVDIPPRIDGSLSDASWAKAEPISDFNQYLPKHGASPSFPTEVRIVYDDQAIYVAAVMKDPNPDSIPMQLGNRDDENMNVDYFGVGIDTYNNQLDAYTFIVTAAGVQIDERETDETYDGVWLSEARKTDSGWIAEMKIPYSAIRFPAVERQEWGLQIVRYIRRYRETDYWAQETQGVENNLIFWGKLLNIQNIEPPVRLSMTPYLAVAAEHYPDADRKNISTSFSGGLDLKYGLNESFTLDMTLLPDFSQVQSDDKVKNLTAYETIYSEQRPFFKEAIDLFEKGDLFYSRRIGQTPVHFSDVENNLNPGERIVKNPVQQKLLNASKLSGRGKSGLAIGILNAVTANTYAIAENESGIQRKILTDPATNYNMVVLAQALKNNSEVFISNTNLIRAKGYNDANVTAGGIKMYNRNNSYVMDINGGVSQNYSSSDSVTSKQELELGYKVFAGIGKTSGNFLFTAVKGMMSPAYDANGMGITLYNNYHYNYLSLAYNIYQPWWIIRDMNNNLVLQNENNFETGKVEKALLKYQTFLTTLDYLSAWINADYSFLTVYDYHEPRIDGKYYLAPRSFYGNIGISSDYRKKFALDLVVSMNRAGRDNTTEWGIDIHPIFRVSDHLILNYQLSCEKSMRQIGFADTETSGGEQNSIFGKRDVTTVINTVSGKYMFRNNLSLNLNARHYWARGSYQAYYTLLPDGTLESNQEYDGNADFNFNVFTVDMVFSWIFAPGSSMNLVWKNNITPEDENHLIDDYFSNLRYTLNSTQRNTVSLKVLYYLDYQQLRIKKSHSVR